MSSDQFNTNEISRSLFAAQLSLHELQYTHSFNFI